MFLPIKIIRFYWEVFFISYSSNSLLYFSSARVSLLEVLCDLVHWVLVSSALIGIFSLAVPYLFTLWKYSICESKVTCRLPGNFSGLREKRRVEARRKINVLTPHPFFKTYLSFIPGSKGKQEMNVVLFESGNRVGDPKNRNISGTTYDMKKWN